MDYKVEDKQYDFLHKDFKKPKSFIYRISVNGRRYYYEMIDGVPTIFASGTTLISDGYPDPSKAMEEWRVKMRVQGEDPNEFAEYRANYGTIMHILFGQYLTGIKIPLHNLGKHIKDLKGTFISEERTQELIDNNLEEFKKDMLAFAQFVKDYNVKPLALELMMRSLKHHVATAIDLICRMDIEVKGFFGEVYKSGENKGKPKETKITRTITAIVDFKSGKKGFYDKHALQLLLNKEIVQENYPEVVIEGIFNFSPKEWLTTPSYNLKDQSTNPVANELTEILSIGKKRHLKKGKKVTIYSGNLVIGTDFDYTNNFKTVELSDYIIQNKENKRDVFEQLIEQENITNPSELRIFLSKQSANYLKELSKSVGIQYGKKDEFIKKLNVKFLEQYGERESTTQADS